jgi:hypothetical protein
VYTKAYLGGGDVERGDSLAVFILPKEKRTNKKQNYFLNDS